MGCSTILRLFILFTFTLFITQTGLAGPRSDHRHHGTHKAQKAQKAHKAGDIVGTLSVCTGQPEGILVFIPGTSFDARTNSSGAFRLSYVQPGTYTLVAQRGTDRIDIQSDVVVRKGKVSTLDAWQVCRDADNDGYTEDVDCDDGNAAINPLAAEQCGDGIDNNCDNVVDENCQTCTDSDSDQFFAQSGCGTAVDCDDSSALINPAAVEMCDSGIDNNCNGLADDQDSPVEGQQVFYNDADGDGFGSDVVTTAACSLPANHAEVGGDCDDSLAAVNPHATEICDGADNNCNGAVDEDIVSAPIQCGPSPRGVCSSWVASAQCVGGTTTAPNCNSTRPPQYVQNENGLTDRSLCDGLDNDCDGTVDERCIF